MCALVIGVYAGMARWAGRESLSPNASDADYNLLVQGFRTGQLGVKKEVPPEFARLANAYDPIVNARYRLMPYRLQDLSYYKGRLYFYFGVTPALILFWPFVALTGHYLSHRLAVLVFCAIGFLASVGVLYAIWRRYFSEVTVWVVTTGVLALGLATVVPVMLPRSSYNQVAISCGYMLTMLSLGGIWCALHQTERRCWWLAAASAAYGLAVGARPSLLFGAIILLVPVAQTQRERRPVWPLLAAAIGPIAFLGMGIMLYNELRFDNPLEFGQHYQLTGERLHAHQMFSPRFVWFNFRVYFLEPARWSGRFPFVRDIAVPPRPSGYARVENPFGVLTNIPVLWLSLAAPLAWRNRLGRAASILRWFVTVVALLFGICALTVSLFWSAIIRYEVDFAPALTLLAVVGVLGLERALAPTPISESGLANQLVWRRTVRCGWGVLLGFSVAFNLLASVLCYANGRLVLGAELAQEGRLPEAIQTFRGALGLNPDYAEAHYDLGNLLLQDGRVSDAVGHYEQGLRIKPDHAEAHNNLGIALAQMGRIEEAIAHYQQAVRIDPDYAEARYNCEVALEKEGRVPEAIENYEQALELRPDITAARDALARLRAGQ